jgi:hypothetical protein
MSVEPREMGEAARSACPHRIAPNSFLSKDSLSALGHVEGQTIVIEYGLARSAEQLPDIAADLIRGRVDVPVARWTRQPWQSWRGFAAPD